MATTNPITGDLMINKTLSKEGEDNWDNIFPPKKKEKYIPPPLPDDMYELEQRLNRIAEGEDTI